MAQFVLNPPQAEAVATTEGPVLVLAGAGTGKTRVVTERIINLLSNKHVPANNIAALTFTNKAATEMRERIHKRAGKMPHIHDLIVSTFHSLCVKILRRNGELLGYRPNFTICAAGEQISIIRRCLREVASSKKAKPEDILRMIGKLKERGLAPAEARRHAVEEDDHLAASVYRKYEESLRIMNALDFDDLLRQAFALLRQNEEPRSHWQDRCRYMMVDEFQDTNEQQFQFVKLLAQKHGNLCVVGDDDQSIYSWRGARPGNIVNFDKEFTGAKAIRLEENYRSVNSILKAANAVIANNEVRVAKSLWSKLGEGQPINAIEAEDSDHEAELIANAIKHRAGGKDYEDYAILVRTNAQTRPIEEQLRIANVPYVVIGGQSFFDRKEVRDILSYLQTIVNPKDDSALLRVINTPPRGLGVKAVESLAEAAAAAKLPLSDALGKEEVISTLPAAQREGARKLGGMIASWRKMAHAKQYDRLVETILGDIKYENEVDRLYDDPLDKAARFNSAKEVGDSLRTFAANSQEGTLACFLQDALLGGREETDDKEKKLNRASVKIITLHSAKGLEFPHVYLPGMQEGLLPHQNSMDSGDISEERRLAYVGFTRARLSLTLTRAKLKRSPSKTVPVPIPPSRFLAEIPPELLRVERSSAPDEAASKLAAMRAMME